MKWIIEKENGIILVEDKNDFNFENDSTIKKVYLTDGKNQYGFMYKTGMFFINNVTFDFKIKVDNYKLIPSQNKTAYMLFNNIEHEHNILCWNIGYKLIGDNELFDYKISIYFSGEVKFEALHFVNGILVAEKELKLR